MADKNDETRNKQPKVRSQQNPQGFPTEKQQNQDQHDNNTSNVRDFIT
jgi:hypothetical protein